MEDHSQGSHRAISFARPRRWVLQTCNYNHFEQAGDTCSLHGWRNQHSCESIVKKQSVRWPSSRNVARLQSEYTVCIMPGIQHATTHGNHESSMQNIICGSCILHEFSIRVTRKQLLRWEKTWKCRAACNSTPNYNMRRCQIVKHAGRLVCVGCSDSDVEEAVGSFICLQKGNVRKQLPQALHQKRYICTPGALVENQELQSHFACPPFSGDKS